MSEEYYQELLRLKNLSSVPSVQKVLEDMINDRPQSEKNKQQVDNSLIREPIKRSRAETQTIYITKGYGWSQSPASVLLYIPFINANELTKDSYSLNVTEKSIELNITCTQKGANYNFKINQLYDRVKSDNSTMKFKTDKIVIILQKHHQGKEWRDLRTKTTQTAYNELERYEKQYESTMQDNFDTPFTTNGATGVCSLHSNDSDDSSSSHNSNNDGNNKEKS